MPKFINPYWQGRIATERNKLEAFQAGYIAYENNQKAKDNPYEVENPLWKQWDKGWHQSKKDKKVSQTKKGRTNATN